MICEACGSDPVNHLANKTSLILSSFSPGIFTKVGSFAEKLFVPHLGNIADKYGPKVLEVLESYGIFKVRAEYDDVDSLRVMVLWQEAPKRDITMLSYSMLNLPRRVYVAKKNDKTVVFDTLPRPNVYSEGLNWMDDKAKFKKRCMEMSIPVSKGGAVRTWKQAKKLYEDLDKPVVVKPHIGSGTKHTTLHIKDLETLKIAFESAKALSPYVIVEEELEGDVYRPTLVNHKLVATLGRIPPRVIGDGKHNIHQLIDLENRHPKRQGPYFHKIMVTKEVEEELRRQGLSVRYIPSKKEVITLHQKINWSVGGTTYDVTDKVHPDNIALFEKASEMIGDCFVGFDFIISDISRSWREQDKCGFIECNAMPFFDNHHLPFEGEPRNVAGPVWELVFGA